MKYKFPLIFIYLLFLTGCTNVFYLPTKQQVADPREIGIKYESVWIEDPGEPRLHAWFFPAKDPIATVLHLHGNAENISTHFKNIYWMPGRGLSVLTLDYRGYGLSEGEVSIEGIHRDIERATRYLKNRSDVDAKKLILFGQSLGGTMALYTAAQPSMHEVFKLVVAESAFSGYRNIAQEKLASSWLTYPFQRLMPLLIDDQYSPLKIVSQIAPTPVLLIHGSNDEVVNIQNSEQLCAALESNCTFWKVSDSGHLGGLQDIKTRGDLLKLILSKM